MVYWYYGILAVQVYSYCVQLVQTQKQKLDCLLSHHSFYFQEHRFVYLQTLPLVQNVITNDFYHLASQTPGFSDLIVNCLQYHVRCPGPPA